MLVMAVNEKSMNAMLSPNLARAKYFAFVSLEDNSVDFLDNPASQSSGGAGIKAGQFLIDNKATVLITQKLGQNASDMLTGTVELYTGINSSLKDNLEKFHNNELIKGIGAHPGYHNG